MKQQIWGSYRFTPGVGPDEARADRTGRETGYNGTLPVGEALRLWTDLVRHGVDAKFLLFPDENHWVLKPQHARVWYETVFNYLDHYVLGKDWVRPALL